MRNKKSFGKNIESLVNQKTNDGTIEVQYIADKRLEAEWGNKENKKCELPSGSSHIC